VLVRERGDVLDLAGRDQLARGAELVEDALRVHGVPGDDRVDDDRQAERLLALLFRCPLTDVALVGVEDRAAERVELLAFVQLPPDPGAELVCLDVRKSLISQLYASGSAASRVEGRARWRRVLAAAPLS
jgi:hypothetical protein